MALRIRTLVMPDTGDGADQVAAGTRPELQTRPG